MITSMESNFQGFVIDPAKCNDLSLNEKRELVHEISTWAENAPEILQSWSRRELVRLICAEMGKERKYTGVTKSKMIEHLLRLVSEKWGKKDKEKASPLSSSTKNQNGYKKKRKIQFSADTDQDSLKITKEDYVISKSTKEEHVDTTICRNVACKAIISPDDKYCKRCSCCICYLYDDNKDPSLWLVCNSDPPYSGESCGVTCHLKCALKHERAGISKKGYYSKLDGSFYCVCCGKVNWLVGTWRKQLLVAKEARRLDVLWERLTLSHRILKGTEIYREAHNIVKTIIIKLKKEVGLLDKVSVMMARGIVNRLTCGAEVQKLCANAVEALDYQLSNSPDLFIGTYRQAPRQTAFSIQFEDLTPFSVVISLNFGDNVFEENVIGCTVWHRHPNSTDYPEGPTCIILKPATRMKISGLNASILYNFRVAPFGSTRELARFEAKCVTPSLIGYNSDGAFTNGNFMTTLKREDEVNDQPLINQSDSQRDSTNSSGNKKVRKAAKSNRVTHSEVNPLDDTPHPQSTPLVSSNSVPTETPTKPDQPLGSPDSANKKETADRQYEYCVKVIRWLECEGHMDKEFRVKFLTWFSLKATAQERRVVNAFIDILIDDPLGLVAQLIDAFMDGICSKEKPALPKGFCTRLWH